MSDPIMYSAILFDMDGLLVDTERLYILANEQLATRYGKRVTPETLAKMMGRGTLESIQIFADDLAISVDAQTLLEQRQLLMLDLLRSDLVAMPHLHELLEYAGKHFKTALVTGSSERLMRDVLMRLNLTNFFDVEQCCDDVKFGKPHPEIYFLACSRLGLEPLNCIVLEDSANGVRAGRDAGCYVIGVPNEHTRNQDLSPAHVIVPDLHAALRHIRQLTPR